MSLIPSLRSDEGRSFAAIGLEPEYPPIRRKPDGGIDFDWYLLRGRHFRNESYRRVFRAIGAVFAAWVKSIREQRARKRAIAELLGLGDRDLRDMGLSRASVYFAVDHGREDAPTPANTNETPLRSPSRSPKVA